MRLTFKHFRKTTSLLLSSLILFTACSQVPIEIEETYSNILEEQAIVTPPVNNSILDLLNNGEYGAGISFNNNDNSFLNDLTVLPPMISDLQELREEGAIDFRLNELGRVRWINGEFTDFRVRTVAGAVNFLNIHSELFGPGLRASAHQVTFERVFEGNLFVFNPMINGVPVDGSRIAIISDATTGLIQVVDSHFDYRIRNVDTRATITRDDARAIATDWLQAQSVIFQDEEQFLQLAILSNVESEDSPVLVWQLTSQEPRVTVNVLANGANAGSVVSANIWNALSGVWRYPNN